MAVRDGLHNKLKVGDLVAVTVPATTMVAKIQSINEGGMPIVTTGKGESIRPGMIEVQMIHYTQIDPRNPIATNMLKLHQSDDKSASELQELN